LITSPTNQEENSKKRRPANTVLSSPIALSFDSTTTPIIKKQKNSSNNNNKLNSTETLIFNNSSRNVVDTKSPIRNMKSTKENFSLLSSPPILNFEMNNNDVTPPANSIILSSQPINLSSPAVLCMSQMDHIQQQPYTLQNNNNNVNQEKKTVSPTTRRKKLSNPNLTIPTTKTTTTTTALPPPPLTTSSITTATTTNNHHTTSKPTTNNSNHHHPKFYQEVVRNKSERKTMAGDCCAECRAFYEFMNETLNPDQEKGEVQHLMNKYSRHRKQRHGEVPPTPPGYWDIWSLPPDSQSQNTPIFRPAPKIPKHTLTSTTTTTVATTGNETSAKHNNQQSSPQGFKKIYWSQHSDGLSTAST
jgi:hypothetical protein